MPGNNFLLPRFCQDRIFIIFLKRGVFFQDIPEDIPNFGFYKFEMAKSNENSWLSIEANNNAVVNGQLGNWNTTRLDPGVYQLRLVVTDNQGQALPPCVVQVNVAPEANP